MSTLTKPITLSILIGAYFVHGHTTCYDELAKTEVKVSCDEPRVEPTVQLRCIHDEESEHPQTIGVFENPKWICAHYQDKQLEGITSLRFQTGWYVSIDKTLCNGLQVPPEGCVTTTTPCRHLSDIEVPSGPSGLTEIYQLTKDATEEGRTVKAFTMHPFTNERKKLGNLTLDPKQQITLLGLTSDGTECTISFTHKDHDGRLEAEISSRDFKIEREPQY